MISFDACAYNKLRLEANCVLKLAYLFALLSSSSSSFFFFNVLAKYGNRLDL